MSDALEDRLSTPTQLLVYGFEPGAKFEGRLVGAIERVESGGTLRVLDVLSSELVDAASFAELTGDLPAAAGGSATQTCTPVPKTTSDERKRHGSIDQ